jgi:MoaA/NifB/PqqE/SkfB family radical SAM enzyme
VGKGKLVMIKEEYSPYKVVHFQKQLNMMRIGIQPLPVHVQVVPTNRCNSNCPMCAYRLEGYTSNEIFNAESELSYWKLFEILNSCKVLDVKAVQFTGGGEPLFHPYIKSVFRKALETGIELSLVTNGILFDDELIDMVSEFAWVRVSLDAATPETYTKTRGLNGNIFEKVKRNVQALVKHKHKDTIGIGFVVFRENVHEIEQVVEMGKDLGVDNVRISAGFTPMGFEYHRPHLLTAMRDANEMALRYEDTNFTVFNNFGDRTIDLFEGRQNYTFCPMKELTTYIGADSNVYTCCTLAYNKRGLIGSIEDCSLTGLWVSDGKNEFFKNHNPSVHCKHPCMYGQKNKFANYCIKSNPKHVGFM